MATTSSWTPTLAQVNAILANPALVKQYTPAQLSALYSLIPGQTPQQAANLQASMVMNGKGAGGNNYSVNPNPVYQSSGQSAFQTAIDTQNWTKGSAFDQFMEKALPIATAAGVGEAFAPAIAAGVAAAGATGTTATIASGAATGAASGATGSALTGQNVGQGALFGAVSGGLGAAAAPAASSLSNATGLSPTLSSGLVKGVIGAGTGALRADVSGGDVGAGAAAGGVGGTVSGLLSGYTGNNAVGNAAGKLAGTLTGNAVAGANTSGTSGSNYIGAAAVGAGALAAGANSSGQGNIGNMALVNNTGLTTGSDTGLAGTVGGLLQAGTGVAGSLAAANAQTNADQSAITTQQGNLANINSIWSTQQGLGQGADAALGSALGTNGQPANYSNFENMPGYQFAVQQGTQAIQRQAAAMGSAYTPNTAAAVGQYVTGTASQDYNTYISQLMQAAGLGTTANQGLQTGSQQTSNNISQLQQNQGQATAAGYSGVASSVGGLFSNNGAGTSLLGAAGNYLNGSGSSSVNGSGVNYSNPQNLGGSTVVAPAGQTLQYDSSGNIIGSVDTSQYTPSSSYGGSTDFNSVTGSGGSDWSNFLTSGDY